jgi:hypothetical protein
MKLLRFAGNMVSLRQGRVYPSDFMTRWHPLFSSMDAQIMRPQFYGLLKIAKNIGYLFFLIGQYFLRRNRCFHWRFRAETVFLF